MDGQRAGGYGLSWVPGDEPQAGVVAAGEVTAGYLEITTVEVALVKGDASVYCYLFGGAAAHVVIGAFDDGVRHRVTEAHRAVFGIVGDGPDTSGGFHQRLVAVGIEGGGEIAHSSVLIQLIGGIACGDFAFCCRVSIADVVVVVGVVIAVDCGGGKLAAVVVAEGVVLYRALAGGVAGGWATESVIAVLTISYQGCAAMARHAGEQIALYFVALGEAHVVRYRELLQQMRAGEVLIAELLCRAAVEESCAGDVSV